ncbi:hypothetical protein [Nonomuraea sp. NPDC005650]|uniref:hypothetical protein n=1 Tax=Nonomuraea sp. NPDC005650 TaxID=3157045 RepID=UPI0033A35E19
MTTWLYTRTNPANGQIEIKHFEIDHRGQPDNFGPVWMTHFYGTDSPADFYAPGAPDRYADVDALEMGDTCYIPDLDGALGDFLPRLCKELDAEGWILLPPPGIRYLAQATTEAGKWHTATGELVTGTHLVVITEAQPTYDEDGTPELAPTNRVAAVLDTGVPADEPAPYVAELLDQHGWLVVGEGDPAADDFGGEFHEVTPADPTTVAAIDYAAGRPVRHYEVGRPVLDERGSLARAVVCAVHVAVESFDNSDTYGLTRDDIQEILLPAARAAVDEWLVFERVPTLGDADTLCKERLFAEACSGITDALAMIRERATCRTCDTHATTRATGGEPVCSNTGH